MPVDPVAAVLEVGDGLGDHPGHNRVLHPAGPVQQCLHIRTRGAGAGKAFLSNHRGEGGVGLIQKFGGPEAKGTGQAMCQVV